MSFLHLRLDRDALEPGERLTGTVEWDQGDSVAQSLWISLLWHTEGKGTEDSDTVDQVEIHSPTRTGSQSFEFQLPSAPWSFSGRLISLIWTVEASLESTDLLTNAPFISAPEGQEILLRAVEEP